MIFFGENEILIVLYSTFEDGNFCFRSDPIFIYSIERNWWSLFCKYGCFYYCIMRTTNTIKTSVSDFIGENEDQIEGEEKLREIMHHIIFFSWKI